MGRRGLFKKEKKYTKLVDTLFPTEPDAGISSHQLQNLVHYASITPNKLQKIGKYLEKRARDELKKNRTPYVEMTLQVFNELISNCTSDITFFAENIVNIMLLLLQDGRIQLKSIAVNTFVNFAEAHRRLAQAQELDIFLQTFIQMATFTSNVEEEHKRMRIHGLLGMRAYVHMVDDLDAFLSKYISVQSEASGGNKFGPFLPALLENIRSASDEELAALSISTLDIPRDRDWRDITTMELATVCLKDLVMRLNNITIRPLLEVLLRYLDDKNLWVEKRLAMHYLQAIWFGLRPQHRHIVQLSVLQHLGRGTMSTAVKTSIVETLHTILRENPGPVIELVSSLLQQLIVSSHSTQEEDRVLQDAIIQCIAITTESVDPFQQLDAMGYILQRLKEDEEDNEQAEQVNNEKQEMRILVRAVAAVSTQLRPLPDGRLFPSSFLSLLFEVSHSPDPVVRHTVYQVILRVMDQGQWLDSLRKQIEEQDDLTQSSIRMNSLVGISGTSVDTVSRELKNGFFDPTNEPPNFAILFALTSLILTKLGVHKLRDTLSLAFELQEVASESSDQYPVSIRRQSIHTVVGAILLTIAQRFSIAPLATYVNEVIGQRKQRGFLDIAEDGHLQPLEDAFPTVPSGDSDSAVSTFFSRSQVVEMIVGAEELQSHPSLKAELMQASETATPIRTSPDQSAGEQETTHKFSRSSVVAHRTPVRTSEKGANDSGPGAISRMRWTVQTFKQLFDEPLAAPTLPSMPLLRFEDAVSMSNRQYAQNFVSSNSILSAFKSETSTTTNTTQSQDIVASLSPQSTIHLHYPQSSLVV